MAQKKNGFFADPGKSTDWNDGFMVGFQRGYAAKQAEAIREIQHIIDKFQPERKQSDEHSSTTGTP